jgi:ribosomal-protein-alanine N-acetyltransferase
MARLLGVEAEILRIATDFEFRRRGVASSLLQAFISLAGQRGIYRFHLELRAENLPAMALYEKYAFEVTGRRPNYYTAPQDDALCMTLAAPHR